LHNQFTDQETGRVIRIPNTLLISAISVIEDVRQCVTMDLKGGRENVLCLVRPRGAELKQRMAMHNAIAEAIRQEWVLSCHDVSDGGYLTAAAEMCIASGVGLSLERDERGLYFDESLGGYLLEMEMLTTAAARPFFEKRGVEFRQIGTVSATANLEVSYLENSSSKYDLHVAVEDLARAWRGTLDW
jgi:phosphoribosylformylglycinamidine synthase